MFSKLIWIGTFLVAMLIAGVFAASTLRNHVTSNRPVNAPLGQNTNALRLEIAKTRVAAPDFELKDPAGRKVRLQDFRGKVVFLNFWATWCPPCVEEMPAMEALHRELKGNGLVLLAVNFQESPEPVSRFLAQRHFSFPVLLDRNGKVAERYQAWGLPVSIIIDKHGEIAAKALGARNWAGQEALQFFRSLLAGDARP